MIDIWTSSQAYASDFRRKHGRGAVSCDKNPQFIVLANGARTTVGVHPLGTARHYWYRENTVAIPPELPPRMTRHAGLEPQVAMHLSAVWALERSYHRLIEYHDKHGRNAFQHFPVTLAHLDEDDLDVIAANPHHLPDDPDIRERLVTQMIESAPEVLRDSGQSIPTRSGHRESVALLAYDAFVDVYGEEITLQQFVGGMEEIACRSDTFRRPPPEWRTYFRRR